MLNISVKVFSLKTFGIVTLMTFKYQYIGGNNPYTIEHLTSSGTAYFVHQRF